MFGSAEPINVSSPTCAHLKPHSAGANGMLSHQIRRAPQDSNGTSHAGGSSGGPSDMERAQMEDHDNVQPKLSKVHPRLASTVAVLQLGAFGPACDDFQQR